jgi:hypothetical protein
VVSPGRCGLYAEPARQPTSPPTCDLDQAQCWELSTCDHCPAAWQFAVLDSPEQTVADQLSFQSSDAIDSGPQQAGQLVNRETWMAADEMQQLLAAACWSRQ